MDHMYAIHPVAGSAPVFTLYTDADGDAGTLAHIMYTDAPPENVCVFSVVHVSDVPDTLSMDPTPVVPLAPAIQTSSAPAVGVKDPKS